MENQPIIIAYTDGACKNNPGKGGYGVHLIYPDGRTQDFCGGEENTTNNRMELMAAITALKNTDPTVPLQLWTDSNYVKNGITQWIHAWKKNNWRKKDGAVLNRDLWEELDALSQGRVIDWQWVKGHAGHAGNERADQLANEGVPKNTKEKITHIDPPMQKSNIAFIEHPEESHFDGDTSRANNSFIPILPRIDSNDHRERQLVMDTETTGLNAAKGDRIIEVGIVEMIARRPTGRKLHVYLNPERDMDEEVIKVHGITTAFLQDKPKFADVAQPLYDFMKGTELIAHNANFDMGFLSAEFDKAGIPDFASAVKVTDSLALAKQMFPAQKNSLDALVRRLNVGKKDRTFHGALLDAEILAEVYLAMTGGQVKLEIDDSNGVGQMRTHQHFANLASLIVSSVEDEASDALWRSNNLQH